jgi:hypothetical protein
MENSWLHHLRAPYKALLVDYALERLQAILAWKLKLKREKNKLPAMG